MIRMLLLIAHSVSVPMADASCTYVGISRNEEAECTSVSRLICPVGESSRYEANRCNEKTAALQMHKKRVELCQPGDASA